MADTHSTLRSRSRDRVTAQDGNPLLAAWQRYEPYSLDRLIQLDRSKLDAAWKMRSRAWHARRKLVTRYSFAIPSPEALAVIAKHGPIVQIGAGTGYWAHLLRRDYNVDILPFDRNPPSLGGNFWPFRREFVPVLRGTERILSRHHDRTLLLCWPPMTTMASNCLRRYRGQRVIVIGEGEGGCTADDEFFAMLAKDWTEAESVDIPRWDCINDHLTVWTRREEGGVSNA
jgi:hypothetical protein